MRCSVSCACLLPACCKAMETETEINERKQETAAGATLVRNSPRRCHHWHRVRDADAPWPAPRHLCTDNPRIHWYWDSRSPRQRSQESIHSCKMKEKVSERKISCCSVQLFAPQITGYITHSAGHSKLYPPALYCPSPSPFLLQLVRANYDKVTSCVICFYLLSSDLPVLL